MTYGFTFPTWPYTLPSSTGFTRNIIQSLNQFG